MPNAAIGFVPDQGLLRFVRGQRAAGFFFQVLMTLGFAFAAQRFPMVICGR